MIKIKRLRLKYTILFLCLLISHSSYSNPTVTSQNQGITIDIGAGGSLTYCLGDPVDLLTGTNPAVRPWAVTLGITPIAPGQANFDPTTAGVGDHLAYYHNTWFTIRVIDPTATLDPFIPDTYCQSDPPFALTGGNPAGGTYWIAGVQQNTFNPSALGAGSFAITYKVGSGGCIVESNPQIINVNSLPVVALSPFAPICIDASPIMLNTGVPLGGTYSGTGVVGNIFTPSAAGAGTHAITYTYSDGFCTNSTSQNITVNPLPVVTFSGLVQSVPGQCDVNPINNLVSNQTSGTFSGNGITDLGNGTAQFNPATSGFGHHNITFTYTNPATGCANSQVQTTRVGTLIFINGLSASYCDTDGDINFTYTPHLPPHPNTDLYINTVAASLVDNGDGTAVFKPSVAGAGNYTITYEFWDDILCVNILTKTVQVITTPTPSFSGLNASYCEESADETLTGNSAPLGTFTGDGILDHGNGTATFQPSSLTVGSYSVTYSITNAFGCSGSDTEPVEILPLPNQHNVTGGGAYCNGTGGLPVGLANSTLGINYKLYRNGIAVIPDNTVAGTGGAITFGNQTIAGTYTVVATNSVTGCSQQMLGSATISILPEVLISTQPVSTTICELQSATFTVQATGQNLSYQWVKNGVNVGINSNVLVLNGVTLAESGHEVYCIVSSSCGGPLTSNTVILTVNPITQITTQPLSSNECTGNGITISVVATGVNNLYRWEKDGVLVIDIPGKITNSNTANLSIINLTTADAGTYVCYVDGDCGLEATSNPAILTVDLPITITQQPTSINACPTSNVAFTTTATGTNLSYIWWFDNDGAGPNPPVNVGLSSTLPINGAALANQGSYYCIITSPCGATTTTNTVSLTLLVTTSITTPPVGGTICESGSFNFTVAANGNNLQYDWFLDGNPLNNNAIVSNATTANLSLNGTTQAYEGNYTVTVTGSCGNQTGNPAALLIVNEPITFITQPASQTICAGSDATFSVSVNGDVFAYEWQLNGVAIPGATNPTYTVVAATPLNAGSFRCKITTTHCGDFFSNIAILTINPATTITANPTTPKNACVGANVSFSVTATGVGLSYQWYKNNVSLGAGATGAVLNLTGVTSTDAGSYTCTVTGTCGVAFSTASILTVDVAPVISNHPTSNSICSGSNTNLTVNTLAGTNLIYQWYFDNNLDGIFDPVPASNSPILNLPGFNAANAGDYYATITNGCSNTSSQIARLTLVNSFAITSQPTNIGICEGGTASFSVTANQANLNYQWRRNGVDIAGATSVTLVLNNVPLTDHNSVYSCYISNSCLSLTSSGAILTVSSLPAITQHPQTETACLGEVLTLTTTASGTNLLYKWYKDNILIPGATNSSYTIASVVLADAGEYHCIVSNSCGQTSSNIAVIDIGEETVITNPIGLSQCLGTDAVFSITATGANLLYEWRRNDIPLTEDGRIVGVESNTLSINNILATDEGTYNVIVTGSCGLPKTSAGTFLDVILPPSITTGPEPRTICNGGNVSFSVIAAGELITYQWQENTVNINPLTNPTATTPTLEINAATTALTGNIYRCIVTNACGSVTSTSAELIVEEVPIISTQPSDITRCENSNITFAIDITGPSGMLLQWYKGATALSDDVRIVGSNLPTLTINSITSLDAGDYWCDVTSSCGNLASDAGTLTVQERIAITQQPISATICPAGTVNLSVVTTGTITSYQWQIDQGLGFVNLAGANGQTYSVTPFNPALHAGSYRCLLTNICETVTSDIAVITEGVATNATIVNGTVNACQNGNISLAVTATGSNLTYQWFKGATPLTDGGRIGGSQTSNLNISGLIPTDAGTYQCDVTGTCGFDNDNSAVLTVDEGISIIVQPVSTSVLIGSNATFTVSATGGITGYEWYKDGVLLIDDGIEITGATTPNLNVLNAQLTDAGTYQCIILGTCGNANSKTATLTVLASTIITTQPGTPIVICETESFTLFIQTSGSGHTYQWKRDDNNLSDGGGISGSLTSSLTINNAIPAQTGAYTCVVNGVEISSASVVIVNPTTVININPVGATKCEGSTHTFSVSASGSNLTYQWFKNNAPIAIGGTTNEYVINAATAADNGTYHCVVTGDCSIKTSSSATLTIVSGTTINNPNLIGVTTICQNQTTTLEYDVTGSSLTFLWKKDGQAITAPNISGITTNKLQISNGLPANSGIYTCTVTSSCAGNVTSNPATITVRPLTAITTQPIGRTKCEGDGVVFTVEATGSNLTYDWRRNDVSIGIATPTLTINNLNKLTHEGTYTCFVSGDCGNIISDPAVLTINTNIGFTTQPQPATTICENSSTLLTVVTVGDGVIYLWKKDGAAITGTNISGINSAQLNISNALTTDAGVYTCTISSTCGGAITSNNAILTVTPNAAITTNPLSYTKCVTDEVTFTVEAIGTGLTYQWKKGDATGVNLTDGLQASGATNLGVTTNQLRITGLTTTEAGSYTCVITGGCNVISTVPATLTINALLSISTQPQALTTICQGTSTDITVLAIGTGLTYKWKKDGSYITNGGSISGVTTNKLVVSNALLSDAGFYSCEITGACNTLNTQSAELQVDPTTTITLNPTSVTLCEGDNAQFMVNATGVAPLTYQWQKNNVDIVGATSITYTINGVLPADAGAYTCIVTGGSTCGTATSSPANLTVNPGINISTQPVNTTVCEDNTAIISLQATGTNLTYKWKFGTTYLVEDTRITGVNTNELKIALATNADEGIYKCEIFSLCGTKESNSVTLTVNDSTKITAHPLSQNLLSGSTAFFNVSATGSNLTYQWQLDNADIAGANAQTYSIVGAQTTDEGNYSCIVTGDCGEVSSNIGILTINQMVSINNVLLNQTICKGATVSFSIDAIGTILSYQWTFNGANLTDGNGISGANSANLTIASSNVSHSGIYACVVTGSNNTANSNTATLTVNEPVSITTHPVTQTKCYGDILVLEVISGGQSLTYAWNFNDIPLVDDGRITGALTSKLVINNITNADAGTYLCVVSNNCTSQTSNPAVVTINQVVTITNEPTSLIRCETQTATFSITTNTSNITYQWLKNGVALVDDPRISGANTANLTITNLSTADAGNYSCNVFDNCTSDNSIVATLVVRNRTVIQSQPTDRTVCEGEVAFFEVVASPTGLTYQWQKNGVNIPNDIAGYISGSKTSVLVISGVTQADIGTYRCLITGGCNNEISNPSELIVSAYPAAAGIIQGLQTVCQGTQSVFYVVPEILNATSYVWDVPYGATISAGQGTRTIQVNYANFALSGAITVYGTNSCGNGTISNSLAITVNPLPVSNAGIDQNICDYSLHLNANNVIGGTWSIVSGDAVIDNSQINLPNALVTNIIPGANTFRWTVVQNGCSAFDEVTITNLKVEVNAGDDQVICSKNTYFDAIKPQAGASWKVVNGFGTIVTPNSPTSYVTGLNQGVNIFAWQINNQGCLSNDEVFITNNAPVAADAGEDQIIAFNETFLNAKAPEAGTTGLWELISGGGTFDDNTDPQSWVYDLMPGPNIIVWTVLRANCFDSDTVLVENILLEPADAGNDQTLCINFTNLNAAIPNVGIGEWSVNVGSANFIDKNNPKTQVTNLGNGTNILRWTIRTSILGLTFDDVSITNNMPTQANAGPDRTLCTNQAILAANTPEYGIGTWTRISGSGIFDSPIDPNSLITNLANGINELKWTIDNNGCVSDDFVMITNNTPTIANAGEDQTICVNYTDLLPNTPTFGTGSWSISTGSGTFNGNSVSQLAPNVNTFIYTITNGSCASTDMVNITNNKPTTPDAGYDQIVCSGNATLTGNMPTEGQGTWTVINGSGNFTSPTVYNTTVSGLSLGMNIFRWTIENNGCVEHDEVIITNNTTTAIAGFDQTLCQNYAQLAASNPLPGTGSWSILTASSAIFDNQSSPNTIVRNLSKGSNTFRWTVTNNGCSSFSDVIITNNTPTLPLAGENQAVCSKSANLTANAITFGTGSWSVMSGSGTFNNPLSNNTSVHNLSAGQNILRWTATQGGCTLYDEVIITSNLPENVFAGNDQLACSDTVVLAANPANIGQGQWSIISGAGSFDNRNLHNTAVRNLGQGDNEFKWTVTSSDCHISDTVIVRSSIPTNSIAGASQILCSETANLGANIPVHGTGSWELVSGSVQFTDATQHNTTATNIARGTNIIAWIIDKDGCQSVSELTLTNNLPTAPFAGSDQEICGDSIILFANPVSIGTGHWNIISGDANVLNPAQNQTTVTAIKFGPNTFRWTTSNLNCVLYDDVVITSNYAFVNAGADFEVNTPRAQLIANVPTAGNGSWALTAGQGTIENPNNFETYVNGLGAGTNVFRWNINYNGCTAFDEVTVNYIVWPIADFEPSLLNGCAPLEVNFVNTSIGGDPYNWTIDGAVVSALPNFTYTFTEPGEYVVRLTATAPLGNTVIKEKHITVYTNPTANFEIAPIKIYSPGQHISCYNYSTHTLTSVWDFGDGSNPVTAFAPTYAYVDTGKFDIKLTVYNNNNCPDSMIIYNAIHVVKRSGFFFPEAFTPNPNGSTSGAYNSLDRSNDVFFPIVVDGELLDFEIKIFSRAGVLVFQSKDINIGWDGYYKNKLLPAGVYIYYITGRYNSGDTFQEAGNVLLIVKEN